MFSLHHNVSKGVNLIKAATYLQANKHRSLYFKKSFANIISTLVYYLQEKIMKVIDDASKKPLKWWNRNYFYVATIIIIAVNIVIYATVKSPFTHLAGDRNPGWGDMLNITNITRGFLDAFAHADWGHVLGNMVCFLGIGLYIERKWGSLKLLISIPLLAFIDGIVTIGNSLGIDFVGFSGMLYIFYAFIIVDYIFSFQKRYRNRTNIIWGAITLGLIYLAMCNVDFLTFSFKWWPIDFFTNMGHYAIFYIGIVIALLYEIFDLLRYWTQDLENGGASKKEKLSYSITLICLIAITIACPFISTAIYNRTIHFNIVCNNSEYNYEFDAPFKESNHYTKESILKDFAIKNGLGDNVYFYLCEDESFSTPLDTGRYLYLTQNKHTLYNSLTFYINTIDDSNTTTNNIVPSGMYYYSNVQVIQPNNTLPNTVSKYVGNSIINFYGGRILLLGQKTLIKLDNVLDGKSEQNITIKRREYDSEIDDTVTTILNKNENGYYEIDSLTKTTTIIIDYDYGE